MERVVDKFAAELEEQLAERKVALALTPAARSVAGGEGLRPRSSAPVPWPG